MDREISGILQRLDPQPPGVASRGSSVELELEKLRSGIGKRTIRRKQLAAVQFYLQSMLWDCETNWNRNIAQDVTCYQSLLESVEAWREEAKEKVCLVTFNYDTMLERALPVVGINIRGLPDYIKSDDYKIVKLHGSISWAHKVEASVDTYRVPLDLAMELTERVAELSISPDFCIVDRPLALPDVPPFTHEFPLFPALAIPFQSKDDYECPPEHQETLRNCLPEVHKLLVIGWRATEKKFLQMLHENLKGALRLMVVAGGKDPATEVKERIAAAGIVAGQFMSTDGGFSDFVASVELDKFLEN